MRDVKKNSFTCFALLILHVSILPAQSVRIKLIEDNEEKKYVLLRTNVSDDLVTILKDTLNDFNRYPSVKAAKQYVPSLLDIQNFELTLKNCFVLNDKVTATGDGELLVKRYQGFNRQYSGFIDRGGDTILVMCLLDFNNKKRAKKFFSNWKYQNGYLSSGLFLDTKPPHIYCFAYNFRLQTLIRFSI